MPTIRPSAEMTLAMVWPQGSVRLGCSGSKPFSASSAAPASTAAASATSNSMLAGGTVRSAGQSSVPKHACAVSASGHGRDACDEQDVRYAAGMLGGMFWLSEKTFSGSYLSFNATSRSNFSSPYDARSRAFPSSSLMKLGSGA